MLVVYASEKEMPMPDEDMKAELERLRSENAALKKRNFRRHPHEGK